MRLKNKMYPPVLILLLIIVFSYSCKKESKCVGGSGGNVIIKAAISHHSHQIYSLSSYRDTIHVKFNSLDYPSNGFAGFNETFVGETGKDYVLLTGLTCGDYYLYATGVDTVWVPNHQTRVAGGIPFTTDQKSGETNVTIPVNE